MALQQTIRCEVVQTCVLVLTAGATAALVVVCFSGVVVPSSIGCIKAAPGGTPLPSAAAASQAAEPVQGISLRSIKFYSPGSELGTHGQMHSQAGQDWLVASILNCRTNGFFLDLASNDAEFHSNTLMLERDFGWRGICAEADFRYFHGLTQRKCQLFRGAVGTLSNNSVTFNLNGGFSGIVGKDFDNKETGEATIKLHTVPLAAILDSFGAPPTLDYVSLDVEGAESFVMNKFPHHRYVFSVLTVERPKADLKEQLESAGYVYLRRNSRFTDVTYIHGSIPNFDHIYKTWGNHARKNLPDSCMTGKGYQKPASLLP